MKDTRYNNDIVFITKILGDNKVAVVKLKEPIGGEVSVLSSKLVELSPSIVAGFVLNNS